MSQGIFVMCVHGCLHLIETIKLSIKQIFLLLLMKCLSPGISLSFHRPGLCGSPPPNTFWVSYPVCHTPHPIHSYLAKNYNSQIHSFTYIYLFQ